ncbi:uncharacterized protein LOC131008759 [Salvia miltiorrhiza]|uniref:uncharacterized protein LOC131008759 n=1 Tax=Salvia miltiorrhiza TaxID=226208 RepID=UPI0025AB5F7E|nr:uncharacterized protein LOC131008759 [Salvia miltiorrhiza]
MAANASSPQLQIIHGCKRIFPTTTDYPWLQTRQIQSLSLSLSISIAQIWEVLHPWLNPTLQIHDSSLFLYKWALEIAERGKSCRKSCRSFFVLGATVGNSLNFEVLSFVGRIEAH